MKKRNKILFPILLMMGLMMTGCTGEANTEEGLILVEKEAEKLSYEMATASVEDVEKTQKASCTYQQINDESLSFNVSGMRVAKVYVEEGDSVVKGQLLAELDLGEVDKVLRDLEYVIAYNQLMLEYIDIDENQQISSVWLNYIYGGAKSPERENAVKEQVENIQKSYRYQREDCTDVLSLNQVQLEEIKKDMKNAKLIAGMDGTVYSLKNNLEGSTSVIDEEVIKIIDSSECLFAVEDITLAECFYDGMEVDMNIAYGTGAGTYKLVPYDMENWEDKLLFAISGGGEDVNIEVGAMGTMRFPVESRSQVISVPLKAVHQADGKHFVYVLNDDKMREVKWIETGLFGDERVEVISGLEEGEKVIIK